MISGRVAMFATIGYILPEYWRFPGYLSKFLDIKFSDVPNGLSAFSKVPGVLGCSGLELQKCKDIMQVLNLRYEI